MIYNMNIFEKTLSNGMRVCLVHKDGYNKSEFMLSTPAGGMDVQQIQHENRIVHKSGCAHYLEHQMFRLDGKDVTEEFAKMQAQTNAFTSYDVTSYFFQTTSDVFEPLGLLMDFVQNLDINEETIEKERGIILSEWDGDKQSPEMRLIKDCFQAMYKFHPIRNNILGTREDISNMTVQDLTDFYNLNYDASRLVLIGITGKDCKEIMEFIEEYQQKYPSKISSAPCTYFQEEPVQVNIAEQTDYMDITTPFVCIGYKMQPCQSVQESLKTDMLIQIKLDSLFSPLNRDYQKWLDEEVISQYTAAECDFAVNRGYILFYSQTEKVDEFINLVNSIVQKMKDSCMEEEVFEAIKASYIGQNIRGFDHFESLAMDLTRSYIDHFDHFNTINMIKGITLEEVQSKCSSLNFENVSKVKILPNSCKTCK